MLAFTHLHNPRSEAGKLLLLVKAELRDQWRWAWQHLYALLVLGPLVLGMTYLTLARMATYDALIEAPSNAVQILLAVLSVLTVMALNLSSASRELYHLRQPAIIAEALPIERATHLHIALAARLGRTLMLGLVLLVLRSLLSDEDALNPASLLALSLFILLTTLSEVYAALNWIHWGSTHRKQDASLSVVVLLASAIINGLLLVLFFHPAAALGASSSSLAAEGVVPVSYLVDVGAALCVVTIYLLARRSHERWRAADIDYAQRLGRGSRFNLSAAIFKRRLRRSVAAMLARDLQLTLRTFSSAVYVAAGICVLLIVSLLMLLTSNLLPSGPEFIGGLKSLGWASATWLPAVIAIKLACVLAVAAMTSVLPVLVYYQLPHMWLERATGATGENVWQAKMWYARLVSLPVALVVCIVGVITGVLSGQGGGVPLYYVVPLIIECLWLWWFVSSMVGALAFEMPDRPELSIVLMLTVSVSVGALTVLLWTMGLGFYAMSIAQVTERGYARARYYLMAEDL